MGEKGEGVKKKIITCSKVLFSDLTLAFLSYPSYSIS